LTTEQTSQDQNLLTAAEQSAATGQADNKQPAGSQDNSAASENSGNSGANGNGGPDTLRSELDAANSTIASLRDQASQANLQAQIDRVEAANQAELAADQQSIEDGNLTAADATQKALNRQQNAQKQSKILLEMPEAISKRSMPALLLVSELPKKLQHSMTELTQMSSIWTKR
tara:strand:+ start:727 stop:1245 length:519 start_codon:yes stop_codon:yes gene_type:complete